jgi:hypothetical protein
MPPGYFFRLCLLKDHVESSFLTPPPFSSEGRVYQLLLHALITRSSDGEQLLAAPHFSGALIVSHPLCCVSFSVPCLLFSFLFCFVFCFLPGRTQSVQGVMLVYPRSGCGSTTCHLFAHLLVCISQADLELGFGSTGALLVSQCNVVWRSFVWTKGLGCQSFASSWWIFFCQLWLHRLSKIFDL